MDVRFAGNCQEATSQIKCPCMMNSISAFIEMSETMVEMRVLRLKQFNCEFLKFSESRFSWISILKMPL